ncbi:MAG: hypothetical protein N2595_08445 [bacterium]|nr:hypothetical protein [bacterium]
MMSVGWQGSIARHHPRHAYQQATFFARFVFWFVSPLHDQPKAMGAAIHGLGNLGQRGRAQAIVRHAQRL